MPRSRGLALSIWVCGDGYIVSSSQMSTKGRLSEKSNIPQCESRIRFWPCIGVRSISVSRGLFGKSGGDNDHTRRKLFWGLSLPAVCAQINL